MKSSEDTNRESKKLDRLQKLQTRQLIGQLYLFHEPARTEGQISKNENGTLSVKYTQNQTQNPATATRAARSGSFFKLTTGAPSPAALLTGFFREAHKRRQKCIPHPKTKTSGSHSM